MKNNINLENLTGNYKSLKTPSLMASKLRHISGYSYCLSKNWKNQCYMVTWLPVRNERKY